MLENKYMAILIKPSNQINKDSFELNIEEVFKNIIQRYSVSFEQLEDENYLCVMPLRNNLMDIVNYMQFNTKLTSYFFAIGICEFNKTIDKTKNDALHLANIAMKKLMKQRRKRDYRNLYVKIQLSKKYQSLVIALDMMNLFDADIQSKWTQKQREIVMVSYFDGLNQKEAAQKFNVSQPNIHQVLKKANYFLYKDNMKAYQSIIEQLNNIE